MRTITLAILIFAVPAVAGDSAWTLLDKGVKAYQKKDYVRAGAFLEAAQRKDTKCYDAAYYLGQIQLKKGKLDKAAKQFKKVPETHSLHAIAQASLGQIYLRTGKKEEALKCLLASAQKRGSANIWIQVADVQIDLKKLKDADASITAAEKLVQGDFRLVEMRGRLYIEMKKYGKALDQYDTLLKKFRDDYTLHNMRGLCLRELERNNEASRSFERVLKLYPYHKAAMRNLIAIWANDASKAARVAELEEKLDRLEKYPPNIRKVKRRAR